jgi:hypothetical protein
VAYQNVDHHIASPTYQMVMMVDSFDNQQMMVLGLVVLNTCQVKALMVC